MNLTSNTEWNCDYTGYFNGKPMRISESIDIYLPRKDFSHKSTIKLVESDDFRVLSDAGFNVHGFVEEIKDEQ